ncbi:rhodanese-like domain-containing protein [Haliangium ochraceum]|uniref:Rhodanese domain protein n=1 Tax=Haliangium ochraceum (strain DSM 14365 / JCM 11303 / SMP-2) TaxID=502025 RepID=D0LZK7_HALO1|nr:rhodanese-like domain-containing protein [Haliangium ochraceum]ACY17986.1 Rhodanese domain protein [Haliangium ochraceum DSM 14365]
MAIQRITPDEAASLLEQGYTYVDVRSEPEFAEGHPEGAYNVPFMHREARSMVPNADFARVMHANFAKDAKLVLGCRSGARSLRAAETLSAQGYTEVIDMRGGFAGEANRTGEIVCEGWQSRGLPVSREAGEGRGYEALESATRSQE